MNETPYRRVALSQLQIGALGRLVAASFKISSALFSTYLILVALEVAKDTDEQYQDEDGHEYGYGVEDIG